MFRFGTDFAQCSNVNGLKMHIFKFTNPELLHCKCVLILDVASCSCSDKPRLFSPQRLLIGPVILELKGILLKLNVISDLLGLSLVITEIAAAKVVESCFLLKVV